VIDRRGGEGLLPPRPPYLEWPESPGSTTARQPTAALTAETVPQPGLIGDRGDDSLPAAVALPGGRSGPNRLVPLAPTVRQLGHPLLDRPGAENKRGAGASTTWMARPSPSPAPPAARSSTETCPSTSQRPPARSYFRSQFADRTRRSRQSANPRRAAVASPATNPGHARGRTIPVCE
jgi:hypothetical protein